MTGAHVTGGQQVQQLEWLSGHPVKVLLDAATTDGQLMLLESTPHAGSASPMHVHTREDEMFVLLKGSAVLYFGEERYTVDEGGVAFLPRGVPHAYRITSDAQMLTLATHAGLEGLFRQAGHDLSMPKPAGWKLTPDMLMEPSLVHGVEILGPPPTH